MHGFRLGPKAQAANYRLAGFDAVGSTNTEAINAARDGDIGDHWFAALAQTEGRGRRGRKWQTVHGNLAASLLLIPNAELEALPSLGFVAGVALHRALGTLVPDVAADVRNDAGDASRTGVGRIALKWPNDVLADGAKLSGILLEAHNLEGGRKAVVIGIGVNVVAAPDDLPYPATSTSALGATADAFDVLEALAESWVDLYALWDNGRGVGEILTLWRQSAAGIGAPITINSQGKLVSGIFETVDDSGRLVVETDDGRHMPIAAGDVYLNTAAHTERVAHDGE